MFVVASLVEIYPALERLFLGASVSTLDRIFPFLTAKFRADIVLTIDVPLGCAPDRFVPLWRVLHRCVDSGSAGVIFNIGGHGHHDAIAECKASVHRKLRKSNVVGEVVLCPKALISVMRRGLVSDHSE